jgi:hypothetical protein
MRRGAIEGLSGTVRLPPWDSKLRCITRGDSDRGRRVLNGKRTTRYLGLLVTWLNFRLASCQLLIGLTDSRKRVGSHHLGV